MKKLFLSLTLLFCISLQSIGQTLAKSNKSDANVNPILPYNLCADPTAVEYEGRLYVYGTNDQQELNTTNNKSKNTYGKITQLVCVSTSDMLNWTFHGTINVKSLSSWIATSWAPSIVSRVEKDGKTHFYLYYTNTASGIGVLTSTSPTGPWKDPLGHALIDWSTPGRGQQSNIIDPGVCIDDEGNGWLTFGGGDPNSGGSKLMPGNARIVKLGSNMISLSGEIKSIPAPFHFEANELNYIGGKFVFSYSGGWSCNAGDWNNYTGRGTYGCPSNCSILSMTTDDPINGTWKYTGEILKNPGNFGFPWGNNHSHLQKFGSNYYMIYHTQYLESKMGISGGYRGIALDKCTVNESTAKITAPSMSGTGPSFLSAGKLDTSARIEAETMANSAGIIVDKYSSTSNAIVVKDIHAGDWTMLRKLTFNEEMKSIIVRTKGTGRLEVRGGGSSSTVSTANLLATVDFKSSFMTDTQVDLLKPIPSGRTYDRLYFVFTDAASNVAFDRFQFSPQSLEEATSVHSVQTAPHSNEYYDLNGRRLDKSSKGLKVRSGKKILVK